MVYRNSKNDAVLYVRGDSTEMKNLLVNSQDRLYENAVQKNTSKGLKSFVFAYKVFTIEEANDFLKKYQDISGKHADKDQKLIQLASELEKDLNIESVIGLRTSLIEGAAKCISTLLNMGVNVHMLSGDTQEQCLMAAKTLNIFDSESSFFLEFDFTIRDSAVIKMKEALEKANSQVKRINSSFRTNSIGKNDNNTSQIEDQTYRKLEVMVSGRCMDFLIQNPDLLTEFRFIMEFTKTLVGFELSPENKSDIVAIFKSIQRNTMAVGDGYNDVNMLRTANVGIQLNCEKIKYHFGDLVVDNLLAIPIAMNLHCRQWNSNINLCLIGLFFYSILLTICNILYQIYNEFSGTSVIDSLFIGISMLFAALICLIFVFKNNPMANTLRMKWLGFYCEKDYMTQIPDIKILFAGMFREAILIGSAIVFISVHVLHTNVRHDGSLENELILVKCIQILCFSIFAYKMFMMSFNQKFVTSSYIILIYLLMILLFYVCYASGIAESVNGSSVVVAFLSPNTIILVLSTGFIAITFSTFYWYNYQEPRYFPILTKISEALSKKDTSFFQLYLDSPNNQAFLNNFKKVTSFSQIYTSVFIGTKMNNPDITKLLLPAQEDIDNEKLGLSLRFQSSVMRKKYRIFLYEAFDVVKDLQIWLVCIALAVYMIAWYLTYRSKEQALICSVIIVTFSGIYYSIFKFKLVRSSLLFQTSFAHIALFGTLFYCYTQRTDYTLTGIVIMLVLALQYSSDFMLFIYYTIVSFGAFLLVLWANSDHIEPRWALFNAHNDNNTTDAGEDAVYPYVSFIFSYLSILLIILLQRYKNEKLIKNEFKLSASLDSSSVKAKDLFKVLLPKFILDTQKDIFEVREHEVSDLEENEVTILFCDIADFDDVVKEREKDIIKLLEELFTEFDVRCEHHGLQKIETVGKTYMAAAGLSKVEQTLSASNRAIDPTLRTLYVAKEMMDVIEKYPKLKLKIGIHKGKPAMGVIGYHKPQFSLIGDVVNTTSRHCTTGDKGRIMMSKVAYESIQDQNLLPKGWDMEIKNTKMKGKDQVQVYQFYKAKLGMKETIMKIVRDHPSKDPDYLKLKKLVSIFTRTKIYDVLKKAKKEQLDKLTTHISVRSGALLPLNIKKDTESPSTPDSPEKMKLSRSMITSKTTVLEETEKDPDEEQERLVPTRLLGFSKQQQEQVINFKNHLSSTTKTNLTLFFLILCLENILQIILKFEFGEMIVVTPSGDFKNEVWSALVLDFVSLIMIIVVRLLVMYFYGTVGSYCFYFVFIILPIISGLHLDFVQAYFNMYYSTIMALRFLIIFLCCIQSSILSFSQTIIYQVYICIVFTVFNISQYIKYMKSNPPEEEYISIVNYLVFFYLSSSLASINNYIHLSSEIQSFNNEISNSESDAKIKEFVERLLPKHLTGGQDGSMTEDKIEEVTLLFADISGFTKYSSDKQPSVVVDMLRKLFTNFDKECSKLDLFKVYTIGDCYVVMSCPDKRNRKSRAQEAADTILLAFKMIDIIDQVREQIKFNGLHMRIGIHTGNIIGGVIGTNIVRYDLYGQDVLIANKMESEGEIDKVQISEATKNLLDQYKRKNQFSFTDGKAVHISSLGRNINTFFVEPREKSDSKKTIEITTFEASPIRESK